MPDDPLAVINDKLDTVIMRLDTQEQILRTFRYKDGQPAERYRWVINYIKTNGLICWGKCADDPEFRRLFKHNTQFLRFMDGLTETNQEIRRRKIENDVYYHLESYNIKALESRVSWQHFRADDPKFHEDLINKVIIPFGEIELDSYLQNSCPDRSNDWIADVVDGVVSALRRHPGINHQRMNGRERFWLDR